MKDPLPTFARLVERIRDEHPKLAYLHVIGPRVSGDDSVANANLVHSNEVLRETWGDRPYIAAGGMDRATAIETVGKHGGLVAFGRHFLANVSSWFFWQLVRAILRLGSSRIFHCA
jgi:NADPH2 dehydrogenase